MRSLDPRREDHTTCTAVAPDVVFTIRMYGTRPLYGPRLVRKFSTHEPETSRSARRAPHEPAIESQLGFYGGGVAQLGVQVLGPVAVGLYSFAVAWILGKIIDKTMGFRVPEEDEVTGVDITQHAETAYDFGSIHTAGTERAIAVELEELPEEAERVTRAR